jgi:hypothetical protein
VQGKSCQLEKIARKVPDETQVESRVKRYSRLSKHEEITQDLFFLPFILPLLEALAARGTLTLAIDGSETGRHCITLMISVIYKKRAIPITWLVVKGCKGHLSQAIHLELLNRVHALIPTGCQIVLLGDGEFDGTELQAAITSFDWLYVIRTAQNTLINDDGDTFSLKEIHLHRGQIMELPQVQITAHLHGPVTAILWWHRHYEQPIYLLTNMDCIREACSFYRRRFHIETFFSDQKSRGFNLHRSHQAIPERVMRLLIPACLAYIWIIFLGSLAKQEPYIMKQIHRSDRCDLSLFQIGLRYLEFLLNFERPIPVSFLLPTL